MNKKQMIILLTVLVVFFGGTFLFDYFSEKPEPLCIYKIPNHIKMKCGEGNQTLTVNFFEISLFRYQNALKEECYLWEKLNDSGFRYEVAVCNESLPFLTYR